MTSDEVPSPVVIVLALVASAAAVASSWRAAAFTAWFGWPGVPALWTLLTGAVLAAGLDRGPCRAAVGALVVSVLATVGAVAVSVLDAV